MCCCVDQEITEVSERTRKVVDETDSSRSLPLEYDSQLREALDKMREEMEERIRQTHDDTEAFYERKVCIGTSSFSNLSDLFVNFCRLSAV